MTQHNCIRAPIRSLVSCRVTFMFHMFENMSRFMIQESFDMKTHNAGIAFGILKTQGETSKHVLLDWGAPATHTMFIYNASASEEVGHIWLRPQHR